ncbi:MAG TPA: MFS transporter [Thermoanaerobaculia bacterium]|nr:MFS transporter [Thermoanaerobaculia bacterium]
MTEPDRAALRHVDRPGAAHRRILALAWGAWASGFCSLMLLSFLLPAIQKDLAIPDSAVAALTGIGVGMTGVGGFLFGWISDRFGRRASLALAMGAFSLGNLACALAGTGSLLFLGRALAGLGIGGTWGGGQAMIGETVPPALRGRYGALAQSGAPVGLGLAAILGSFLAPSIGWRITFGILALPGLALLFFRQLPESDLWLAHRAKLAADAGGGSESGEMARARRPVLAQLVAPDQLSTFVRAFLLTAFNMSAYWFAVIWLPRYLQKERGLTIFGTGWWTLTFVAGSLVGYLSFGWVSDRIGRRPAFALYCAVTALGLALVTLFWAGFAARPAIGLACLFVAGLGTGTWSCYGPYFSELFPTRVRGTAMAVIMNSTRGIQYLTPLAIAAVASMAPSAGMGGGIALAAGFALLAGAWVWTLPETAGAAIEN